MALTEQQDIPKRPEVKEPWTIRRLFPFAGSATSFIKTFTNPLEILLGYLIFIIGITELFGRSVSWMFWAFAVSIFFAVTYERYEKRNSPELEIKSKVKKEEKK